MSETKSDAFSEGMEKAMKHLYAFARERNMTKEQVVKMQEFFVRDFLFREDKKPAYVKHLHQLGILLLGFNTREEAEDFVENRVEEGLNIPIIEQDGFFFVELDYSNET